MQLIDTHSHLYDPSLVNDLEQVLERARAAEVTRAIVIGTDLETSRSTLELCQANAMLFAVIGFQPNHCRDVTEEDWQTLLKWVDHPKVIGIGETGLDRYWKDCPFECQWAWFSRHLNLAVERQLPMVVHMRDCEADIVNFLEEHRALWPIKGIMHSFTGSWETAEFCLNAGLHISFAGMATYKSAQDLREVARRVPHDRILIETDSPYLSPEPFRGKRPNEPARVRCVAECLAQVRGISLEDFAIQTTENAVALFGL